jgi:hypothetical protein
MIQISGSEAHFFWWTKLLSPHVIFNHSFHVMKPKRNTGAVLPAFFTFIVACITVGCSTSIAAFDQDGTTWVEHPMYTQLKFMLDRLASLAPQHPE